MLDSSLGFSDRTLRLAKAAREEVRPVWDRIGDLSLMLQARVLDAFRAERIALTHLSPSTGYGYGDAGRDALDRVYARVFGAERALVRLHWASGTHVLKTALFALLRPGDGLLCVTGEPYETMIPVIGVAPGGGGKPVDGSLRDFGVHYRETEALLDYQEGKIDFAELERQVEAAITPRTKVIHIQRSRGYSPRKSISMSTMEAFLDLQKRRWPGVFVTVDNCYCEFTQEKEPPAVGASLTAGSLIKNPGGGICPTGGYVAGTAECVSKVAEALYAPGLSGEVGSNPYGYRDVFQGLFLAPKTVAESLMGAAFAAALFRGMGLPVDPSPDGERCDIVQAVTLGDPEKLRAFARAIQEASPVDSFAAPEPWDMPGYRHQVIMAAGCFVQGSSIELSCDAPFIHPYTAYLQGGLSKEHVMLACMRSCEALLTLDR